MANFKITDVKELSLDLGQEAANTQPPPRASPLRTKTEELTQPPRYSPNLQINVTVGELPQKVNLTILVIFNKIEVLLNFYQ